VAEKISNGSFTTGIGLWTNYGAHSFVGVAGEAQATSIANSGNAATHKIRQSFAVENLTVGAYLSVWVAWAVKHTTQAQGVATFQVYLKKPDATEVLIAQLTETGVLGDNSGSGWLLAAYDITADFDQIGEYAIELVCTLQSAWHLVNGVPVYQVSQGWYDDISLDLRERFTKTVLEAIGSGEIVNPMAGPTVLEVAGLSETLTSLGGGPDIVCVEKAGVQEDLNAKVTAEIPAESAGLHESLERTYHFREHEIPANTAGLKEYLKARWQQGNVTMEKELIAEPDIWTDIPTVSTDWE
jgi:hypothetical protein